MCISSFSWVRGHTPHYSTLHSQRLMGRLRACCFSIQVRGCYAKSQHLRKPQHIVCGFQRSNLEDWLWNTWFIRIYMHTRGSWLVKLTAALVAAATGEVLSNLFYLTDRLALGAPGQYCFITTQNFPVQGFTEYRIQSKQGMQGEVHVPVCKLCELKH